MPSPPSQSEDPAAHFKVRICLLLGLGIGVFFSALLGLSIGTLDVSLLNVLKVLGAKFFGEPIEGLEAASVIIWEIRMPRVCLALVVGAGLALAGSAMQGVFRNPLADPGIIGVSGGGAVGAILMIVVGGRILPPDFLGALGLYATPVAAMIGAVSMTFFIYSLSQRGGHVDVFTMLLVGVAVNALSGAFIGFLTFVANDQELRTLTFWNLGSLNRANWGLIAPAFIFMIIPMVLLPRYANALNALLLGEANARYLGIEVPVVKRVLIALSASLVGVTVALCGGIGFIALVAPHMIRVAIGPDHRLLMPASALLGAILLCLADLGARAVAVPAELPIGIITALIGAPVFLYILLKGRSAIDSNI